MEEKENTFTIELFMHPTFDFIMEILRFCKWCEVLEPVYFRNEIIEEIKKLNKNYKV